MSAPREPDYPTRIGVVHFLNSWPLAWGLWQGPERADLEVIDLSPARIADGLAEGSLDVGLLPTVELLRIPGLRVVPGLGIGAFEEVLSVLLVTRGPLARVESVAVDENSRTSVALLRILLADRFGLSPRFVPAPPRVDEMLADHQAALVIGDPALRLDRRGLQTWDLASEWRSLTGLPFVFAAWSVSPACRRADLGELLTASYQAGRAQMPRLVEEAAAESGLPAEVLETYYTHHIHYELGAEALAGLAEFHRRAAAHGLVAGVRPLELWSPSTPAALPA